MNQITAEFQKRPKVLVVISSVELFMGKELNSFYLNAFTYT